MYKRIIVLFLLVALLLPGCQNRLSTESPQNTDPLYGKIALFLGDSICAGNSVDESSKTYGYGWAGLVGRKRHMVWENYGKDGAVISQVADRKRTLMEQASSVIAKYPTADYILLEGGTNDADEDFPLGNISPGYSPDQWNTSDFSGSFEALIFALTQAYPEAKIGYIIPPKMGTVIHLQEHRRVYFDRAVEICEKWDVPVLDLWNNSPMDPMLPEFYGPSAADPAYTDGQHLTQTGYDLITPEIEVFMEQL